MTEALREAVQTYKNNILEGLFGLDDEEKERRIGEFKAMHYPENGTDEEVAAFYEKLLNFLQSLETAANKQGREMLITNAAERAAENEMECIAGAIRSRVKTAIQSSSF